jgi:Zn-dependent peptidase ImmA (M78 family)
MRMPVSVLVLGKWVPVKYYKQVHDQGEEVYGVYCRARKSISISTNTDKKEQIFETILHEIGHAILDVSRIAEIIGHDTDEAICDLMADELSQLVRLDSESSRIMWEYIDLDTVPDEE